MFYLHDCFFARMLLSKMTVAEQHGVTPDITADSTVQSESYWRHEQDITADIVRQMHHLCRESVAGDEISTYQNSLLFHWCDTSLEFPNLFVTIAPAEWKFPMHCSAQAYYPDRGHDMAAFSAIHMYQLVRDTMEAMLNESNSRWFTKVFHYIIRLEYQQRGTIHFHIAIWCIPKHPTSHYIGRTGMTMRDKVNQYGKELQETSPFHAYLESLFESHVDVQWTTGRLN